MRFVLALCALAFLSGCATRAVETEAILKSPPSNLPRVKVVEDVPFIAQTKDHCGPATLAMALQFQGKMISVDRIADETYTAQAHGTYQTDLVSAARRQGMLALQMHGLPALLTEVAAGHPVIVFENLAFNWYPMYHYALVYGYDLDKTDVVMNSGPVKAKRWDMRKFERSWMLGDYWGLIVLKPGEIAPSQDDLAHAVAGSALEQLGRREEARKVYESVVRTWPESLSGLIALANVDYADDHVVEAARLLERAVQAHPDSAPAWHNLAIAQAAAGEKKAARSSAMRALRLVAPEQKQAYQQSLKDAAQL